MGFLYIQGAQLPIILETIINKLDLLEVYFHYSQELVNKFSIGVNNRPRQVFKRLKDQFIKPMNTNVFVWIFKE